MPRDRDPSYGKQEVPAGRVVAARQDPPVRIDRDLVQSATIALVPTGPGIEFEEAVAAEAQVRFPAREQAGHERRPRCPAIG